jgi:hypothetical protein
MNSSHVLRGAVLKAQKEREKSEIGFVPQKTTMNVLGLSELHVCPALKLSLPSADKQSEGHEAVENHAPEKRIITYGFKL